MRVTKKKLTKKEVKQITKLVDDLVTVNDFTTSVDFSKDVYALFKEELSKRKIFKSFWDIFKDIKKLYTILRFGNLMKNVTFYGNIKTFLKYLITSSLFRELDKLDPMEALEKFLKMFKPPQPQPQPQSQPQQDKRKGKGEEKSQQQQKDKDKGKSQKQQEKKKQKGKSPSGKSKDKKGLDADKDSIPIDMTKFKQKIPQLEKAIDSGLFDKDDFQKYLEQKAGIGHNEIHIGNIVKLVNKIAENLTEEELNIFYVARKKELTEKYRRDEVLKSVPYPDNEMSIKNIEKYQDLLKTLPAQYALDDDIFNQKLLKKELLIRDYQSRRLKKQALYLLIDISGSMDGDKNTYASGVALALVRQAISEGSTYFLRFFDDTTHKLHKITNKEDAGKMCDILVKKPFSGGGTDITKAVKTAIRDIKKDPTKFEKSEIMIITDGQDNVSLPKSSLKKIKVHSTVISGENSDLKEISDTYVELDSKDVKN